MSYNPPRMSSAVPAVPPAPITRDLPCITCGYNLRTQPINAHCPECDTPATRSFEAYAARLAGADRRWLRKLTSAAAWLTLSMLIPAAFAFVRFPLFESRGDWLSTDRQMLALALLPYACALVACWRLAAKEPNPCPEETDQPITRWALRISALLWMVPILLSAGPLQRDIRFRWHDPPFLDKPALQSMLFLLTWSGVPATILVFRRLKHIARRIPSKSLLHLSTIIGSQLPIASVLLAMVYAPAANYHPEAFLYATLSPLPGAGLPWPLAFSAYHLRGEWANLLRHVRSFSPEFLLGALVVIVSVGALALAIQFLIALIRVRRADHQLTTYSRELLSSQAPSKNPIPPEPSPASSV